MRTRRASAPRSRRRGRCAAAGGWCSSRAPCGSWARTPRRSTPRSPPRWWSSTPDLLAAVGEFVPALAPYAARLGERLVTAADPIALGPLIASRLQGDEVVVLKASRGVALERILPALTDRADSPRLRRDVLSLARAARQDVHHLQPFQLHQLSRRRRHRDGAAARVRRRPAGHRAAARAQGGADHPGRGSREPPDQARHARRWAG